MLKSVFILSLIAFLSIASTCSKEEETPMTDNYPSMLGTWNMVAYNISKELTDGRVEYSSWKASEHPGIWVHWAFKSDGTFISSGNGGQGAAASDGNWELVVQKGSKDAIEEGTLTLTGEAAKQAATLFSGGDKHVGKITASTDSNGAYFFVTYEADVTKGYFPNAKKVSFTYEYRIL